MSRFLYVIGGISALLLAAAGVRTVAANPAGRPNLNREAVLKEMVVKVIAPAYADLDTRSQALSAAIKSFTQNPNAETLQSARDCWKNTFLSAQKLSCFKIGPVADQGHATAFYFSAIRPASIERLMTSNDPLTAEKVEEMGATTKGLRAIEYLLTLPSPESALEKLKSNERRRLYLQLLTDDVAFHAAMLAKDWKPPISESAQKFVEEWQESINALVNQLAWSVEDLAERQVRPLIVSENRTGPVSVDGQMVARMEGIQRILCEPNGVVDMLKSFGAPAGERLGQQIPIAAAKLKELEAASGEKRQELATGTYDACRKVELLIKVDAASALGVTLTFSPIDGD